MATYGADIRNAVAAAIAAMLSSGRLFLLSETGRTLAAVPMPAVASPSPGVLEIGPFPKETVLASGEPTRYEVRQASGLVLLSGAGSELRVNPPVLVEGGLVYIDGFTLTV
jgi:hypothetical protein